MRFLREKFFHLLPEPTARTFRSALAIAAIAVVLALVMAWRALLKSDLQGAPPPSPTELFDEGTSDIAPITNALQARQAAHGP